MSDNLSIEFDGGVTAYRPGATIRGMVAWSQTGPIDSVRVCLVWYTEGKGTRDMSVVQEVPIVSSRSADQQPFTLTAPPDGPFSFSGKLVSVIWAVELLIEPESRSVQKPIVISPTGTEIDLYAGATDKGS